MSSKKVSILIPSIRPKLAKRAKKVAIEHAGVPKNDVEVLIVTDDQRIGAPKMVKLMVSMASHELVMFLGEDCLPHPNFLREALRVMATLSDGWGLVGLNDQFHDGNHLATHWLADKRLLPLLGGEFFHTGYIHLFCDRELTDRCKELKRYAWAEKSIVKHMHPIVQKDNALWDEGYESVYNDEVQKHDSQLYHIRKQNKWQTNLEVETNPIVSICTPCAGDGKRNFWRALERMRFASLAAGIDTASFTRGGSVISHNRNLLVQDTFLKAPRATHILWLDDDMYFENDLLVRLLQHKRDIVCANAYRKYEPFVPVVSVMRSKESIFNPIHIRPDDPEAGLKRVTSSGTGCVLEKIEVIKKLDFPWFDTMYVLAPEDDADRFKHIEGHVLIGEDTYHMMKATKAGFKIYCDFSLEVGHISNNYIVTWKDHERCINNERNETDDADEGPALRRIRDRHDDQPGAPGRLQQAPA